MRTASPKNNAIAQKIHPIGFCGRRNATMAPITAIPERHSTPITTAGKLPPGAAGFEPPRGRRIDDREHEASHHHDQGHGAHHPGEPAHAV